MDNFMELAEALQKHLAAQKLFVTNPTRVFDVNRATVAAKKLFPDAKITIEDDPLQMGALILCIEDFDLAVRKPQLFFEIIEKADNFEVYPAGEENVKIAVLFNHALTRLEG